MPIPTTKSTENNPFVKPNTTIQLLGSSSHIITISFSFQINREFNSYSYMTWRYGFESRGFWWMHCKLNTRSHVQHFMMWSSTLTTSSTISLPLRLRSTFQQLLNVVARATWYDGSHGYKDFKRKMVPNSSAVFSFRNTI